MADRRLKLRLGLFVAGTLAVLAGMVVVFGRAPTLFSNRASYVILFTEAPGVTVGTPIRKSGVAIGQVTELDLDPLTNQVRVGIAVERKFLPRKNEDATVTRGLLSGDTAIDFLPKLADGVPVPLGEPYPPGSEIVGLPPVTARSVFSQASGVIPAAQMSLEKLVTSIEKFEKLAPKIEKALDSVAKFADRGSELAADGRTMIPEITEAARRLKDFIGTDPGSAPVPPPARQPELQPPPNGGLGVQPPGAVVHMAAGPLPTPPAVVKPPAGAAPPAGPPVVVGPGAAANLRSLTTEMQRLVATLRPAADRLSGAIDRLEPELMATSKQARQTLATADGTFSAARATFDNLNAMLSPENRKQFDELIKNVALLSGAVLRLANGLNGLVDDAKVTLKNYNDRAVQAESVLADLRAITQPLAQRGQRVAENIDTTLDNFARASLDARALLNVVNRSDGTVMKLLTDPALYQNLNQAAIGLAQVLCRTDRIARDLETFADKIARRPELIGVGGAIRPSTGLKDAPTAPLSNYQPEWPPPAAPPSVSGRPAGGLPPVTGLPVAPPGPESTPRR